MARLVGTAGNDTLTQASNGSNGFEIFGLGGNDTIRLLRDDDLGGDNTVNAGLGNDIVLNQFEGGNIINLGGGADTYVGLGFSTLNFFDIVRGGAGNDTIAVTTFTSEYFGDGGKDTFMSEGWENVFNGGAGVDTIDYRARGDSSVVGDTAVIIELDNQIARTGTQRTESLISIENAIGTNLDDDIFGSAVANRLNGADGADIIAGLEGNDVLIGGAGSDTMEGGLGLDAFVFDAPLSFANIDTITDFSVADDTIRLKKTVFNALGTSVEANEFTIGSAATTTDHHLIYNSATGQLSFDADGVGGAAAQAFASLTPGLTLTAADFLMV